MILQVHFRVAGALHQHRCCACGPQLVSVTCCKPRMVTTIEFLDTNLGRGWHLRTESVSRYTAHQILAGTGRPTW